MRCARELLVATLFCLLFSPAAVAQDDTTAAPTAATKPDTIYLKDGRVFVGRIVDSMPTQRSWVIRLRDGRDMVVTRAQTARVVRVSPLAVPAPPPPQRVTVVDRDGHEITSTVVTPGVTRAQPVGKRKSPALAWFLSFLVPGVGQYYNGEWEKGVGFMAVQIATASIYLNNQDECELNGSGCSSFRIALLVGFANWVGTMIDAPVSASAINRKNGFALQVGPQPHHLGISLATVRF